jgi:hypothetical protein
MANELSGQDRAVLEELANRGDVGAIPREVTIWIYGSEDDLRLISSRLNSAWSDAVPTEEEGQWSIMAKRVQEATNDAVLRMSSEIEAALIGTSAVYDGWETSVAKSN